MSIGTIGTALQPELAVSWVRDSLKQGSSLAKTMSEILWMPGLARVLCEGPLAEESAYDFQRGGRVLPSDADVAAGRLLGAVRLQGVKTLVVEDDLRRRGDPNFDGGVSFLDDRVLHSRELDDPLGAVVRLLRMGSSGYPLNAFLCDRSRTELGLVDGREIGREQSAVILGATRVVIVAVYDAEAYLAWLPPAWH